MQSVTKMIQDLMTYFIADQKAVVMIQLELSHWIRMAMLHLQHPQVVSLLSSLVESETVLLLVR